MDHALMDHALAAAAVTDPGDRIGHGAVHLDVVDAGRSLGFWRDAAGLIELPRDDEAIRLGAGSRELVVLHPGAQRGAARGAAGLYHLALHLPSAPEFARLIARLATARVPQAPTDHVFSMATYLTDPDGIGLEFTLETPERFGRFDIGERGIALYDHEGRRRGPTERLDLDPLFALLPGGDLEGSLPAGTRVGHIHLHVPDLAVALRFYRDVIGFDEHMNMPAIGMADLSAGGRFPHRLALNTWHGPHAAQPPAGTAGMRRATLVVPGPAQLEAIADRLDAQGLAYEMAAGDLRTADPAGNVLRLTATDL